MHGKGCKMELDKLEERIEMQMRLIARLIADREQVRWIEDETIFLKRIIGSYCTARRSMENGRRMDLTEYDRRIPDALA